MRGIVVTGLAVAIGAAPLPAQPSRPPLDLDCPSPAVAARPGAAASEEFPRDDQPQPALRDERAERAAPDARPGRPPDSPTSRMAGYGCPSRGSR